MGSSPHPRERVGVYRAGDDRRRGRGPIERGARSRGKNDAAFAFSLVAERAIKRPRGFAPRIAGRSSDRRDSAGRIFTAAQAVVAPGTLAATVSDNTTWSANAKYVAGPATFYFGYENIEYSNPAHPLSSGVKTVGGYQLSFINNVNFTHHKVLQITWFGVKYRLNKTMYVTGAYYRYDQSNFAAVSCSDAPASSCSGQMNSASVVVTKKLIKNLDVYGGLNYSADANGLASGFLNRSVTSPMVGARFNF